MKKWLIFPYAKIKSEKIFHFILAKRLKSIQDLKKKKKAWGYLSSTS